MEIASGLYKPRDPRTTALIAVRIPKHARKELQAYLSCGLLCRGFARLKCEDCGERRLVAFSCKGFAIQCKPKNFLDLAQSRISNPVTPADSVRRG